MQIQGQDPRCCNKPSTWQKRHPDESSRLNPLRDPSTVRFTGTVNNIYQRESEFNEVPHGRYNSNYKGGYNNNRGNNNYKGKNDYYGKKDWNKNSKGSYQKKEDKKESKDKDVYLTLTKDVKFHCPAGFDEKHFCLHMQDDSREVRQC